jgi:hypothetical protein
MIVTEIILIENEEFQHTYSDAGFYIKRDGIQYEDAMDPVDSGRTYIETDIKIPVIEEDSI